MGRLEDQFTCMIRCSSISLGLPCTLVTIAKVLY